MQPSTAFAAPASPLPAPRATTGTREACATFMHATTSSVLRGRTRAAGIPAGIRVMSVRWASSTSGSSTTRSAGSTARRSRTSDALMHPPGTRRRCRTARR